MLSFIALMMSPIIPQEGVIIENSYVQPIEQKDDETYEIGHINTPLSNNSKKSHSGKIMKISKNREVSTTSSNDAKNDKEIKKKQCNQQIDSDLDIDNPEVSDDEAENDDTPTDNNGEIQEASLKKTISNAEKELVDSRMILLASNIARDLGMNVKVRIG